MGKPTGFLEAGRKLPARRPVPVRLRDWREVYEPFGEDDAREQAARCMDCGIPFCHEGCPLGNLIPEWNDLVYRGDWSDAIERLHATNNFPEFTGRLCPAPCEGSCVLGISQDPVSIERTEYEIIERAWAERWVRPITPDVETGKRVAVVGSGPAGLAAAQQLRRAGHQVVVFERAEKPGGLMRYGIPEFKMEKGVLDRRLAQLEAEGVEFRCGTAVGFAAEDQAGEPGQRRGAGTANAPGLAQVSLEALEAEFDAVLLAAGASKPRDLVLPGRELEGVYLALEYLKPANMVQEGSLDEHPINAAGKRVVIIGGGDTGADCLGTAHRQGAAEVQQLEIMEEPPTGRAADNPWPQWPTILRTSSAHEEGGERLYAVETVRILDDGNGKVCGIEARRVTREHVEGQLRFTPVEGSEFTIPCELVFLAMGFVGAEREGLIAEAGVALDPRGSVAIDEQWRTSREGVFSCGDLSRGQSLIVWAIAEGRSAAAAIDAHLMGASDLPSPVVPGQLALR